VVPERVALDPLQKLVREAFLERVASFREVP
jgi:hypothetical protein